MAGILAGAAVCFHFCTMANSIMTAPRTGTAKNGAPRRTVSRGMASGDCATTRLVRTIFSKQLPLIK